MKKREKEIIYYLVKSKQYVTGKELANLYHVTSRTIRDDMNEIKTAVLSHGAEVESQSGRGYYLNVFDYKLFEEYLNDLKLKDASHFYEVPDNADDRVCYMIKKLLMLDFSIKIDDLAEELYISRSTLTSELKQVRNNLEKYDLLLAQKPGQGLKIEGEEIKKRLCIAEYYFHNSADDGYFIEDSILFASAVSQEEIATIKTILLETLSNYQISMSDVSFQNLVVHLIVSIRRMRYSYNVCYDPEKIRLFQEQKEYCVAQSIADQLGKCFNELWNESEICYLASHILAKKMILQEDQTGGISQKIHFLIEKIVFEIYMRTGIDLGIDKEFKNALACHLNPLMLRLQSGLISRNRMLGDIVMNYPFAYELALIAKKVIEEEVHEVVVEDECGFLALYIGLSLEKMSSQVISKQILLVSSLGRSSIEIQKYKIMNQFSDFIKKLDVVELYELPNVNHDQYDLILSSVPISYKVEAPVLYVHSILRQSDFHAIKERLMVKYDRHGNLDAGMIGVMKENPIKTWTEFQGWITKHLKLQCDDQSHKAIWEGLRYCVQNEIGIFYTLEANIRNEMLVTDCTVPLVYDKHRLSIMIFLAHQNNDIAYFQQNLQALIQFCAEKQGQELREAKREDLLSLLLHHMNA